MIYEFSTKDGKRPAPDDVPTRVSVGGREYDVRDMCVEAPARHERDLADHGFRPRKPDRVEVKGDATPASRASAQKGGVA